MNDGAQSSPGVGANLARPPSFEKFRRHVLRTILALTLGSASQSALKATPPSDPLPGDLEVKAVFVLNFIRLVNWASLPDDQHGAGLTICALSRSDFVSAVEQTVADKSIGDRQIQLKINPNPDPAHCRALIVDAIEYPIARPAVNAVRDFPVLTIGNGPGFLSLGGMFELIVEDRKVQFDADLGAIRRSRLDVSARLLQLSRNLRKGAGRGL
jgi:uncharacterized protein DUF4154